MAKTKKQFTLESNIDKITTKIHEKPAKVMNIIGQNIVREIKSTTMKSQFHLRRGILTKTLGYWARRQEKDLQIGFKLSIPGIIGRIITGQENDPIKPVVVKNAEEIKNMIALAIDEIRKE